MTSKVKLNGIAYDLTRPDMPSQGRIDAYVLAVKGNYPQYDTDQIIGFTMLQFNLCYDLAKHMVEKALPNIHGAK